MKKGALFILIFFLLASGSYALVKTKIYGNIDPNTALTMVIAYSLDGQFHKGQEVKVNSNNQGYWDFNLNSDGGEVNLKVVYNGEERNFSCAAGGDCEIKMFGEIEASEIPNNETDSNPTYNSSLEAASNLTSQSSGEENNTQLTGESISGDDSGYNFKDLNIFFIILGLFIMLVIANLTSDAIAGLFKGAREKRKYGHQDSIKMVKLSEKLDEAKKQFERAQQQIQEAERFKKELIRK